MLFLFKSQALKNRFLQPKFVENVSNMPQSVRNIIDDENSTETEEEGQNGGKVRGEVEAPKPPSRISRMKLPTRYTFGVEAAYPMKSPKKKTPDKNDRARKEVKKSEESPVKSSMPTRKNKRNTRSSAREGGAGSN